MMKHVTGQKPVRQYYTSGWELGQAIAEALKNCGDNCDRNSFRDALEKVNITDTGDLAGGPIGFSSTCHQGFRTAMIYRWNTEKKHSEYVTALPYYTDGPCASS
jgi:ABC-type branched-subunit amino acid transport system substrate-binding protein